jgi:hypothetical protein
MQRAARASVLVRFAFWVQTGRSNASFRSRKLVSSRPGEIDITTATLDRPEDFAPTRDVYSEEKLPWVDLIGAKR